MALSLDDVIKVIVNISPQAIAQQGFDLGLILGDSSVISTEIRVKEVAGLDEMSQAGFLLDSPEYKAAQMYFSQSPRPGRLLVGRIAEDEAPVTALQAVRNKRDDWYACYLASETTDQEKKAVAANIETLQKTYFYDTDAEGALTGAAGNIALAMQEAGYRRTIGLWSATENGSCVADGLRHGRKQQGRRHGVHLGLQGSSRCGGRQPFWRAGWAPG